MEQVRSDGGGRMPDRAEWLRTAYADGWRPLEPLHQRLLEWVGLARFGSKVPGIMAAAAPVEWPWDAASLQAHVATVAYHYAEKERISLEERRGG